MALISPEYAELNERFHEENAEYGIKGGKWANQVVKVCEAAGTKNVLDYGCGKGKLVEALTALGYDVRGYDPSVERFKARPSPADIVVCTDVLEHIEPESLDEVLDDIHGLTRVSAFLLVSTVPARKILPDGRNAHLIQKPSNDWLRDVMRRFRVIRFVDMGAGALFVVMP